METPSVCPECGAEWRGGQKCQDYFYQMLYWEAEEPARGEVHHLMVLCYHLQHPSLYAPDGLKNAKGLLAEFVLGGITPAEVRKRDRAKVDSGARTWKIKARPDLHAAYAFPVTWTITAAQVVTNGADQYCDSVRAWACSIVEALKTSGNL